MNQTKILALKKENMITLVQFAILMGTAMLAPLFHQQAITGSIVNATLFISVVLLGPQSAVLIGLIPSLIALPIGLLSPVLAPMIPFIVMGNTILIMTFNYLKDRSFWLGVILASILKFVFLLGTSSIIVNLVLRKEVASKIAMMMGWPQLFTALAGGLISYFFLKSIKTKE